MIATEPSGRAPKRGRGVVIALALSLALNVFLVGGLLGHLYFDFRFQRPLNPIQRFERISHEMHLSGPQLIAFREMIATVRDHRRALFQKNHPIFDNVWDQLAKAKPDDKAIADLITQADTNRLAFQKDATAAMESFLATLSPQQRAQFTQLAKWPHPEPPRP